MGGKVSPPYVPEGGALMSVGRESMAPVWMRASMADESPITHVMRSSGDVRGPQKREGAEVVFPLGIG